VQGARCGNEKVCVDPSGAKIPKSALISGGDGGPGGETGSGGGSGSGSGSGNGNGSGSGSGSGSGNGGVGGNGSGSGGSAGASGGTAGTSSSSGGIGGNDGGLRTGGVAGQSSCYSPAQNLAHVNEPDAVGCRCSSSAPGFCVGSVALVCTDGRWQAVEDGPCWGCWTPDQPDLAEGNPSNGCACTNENETACMHTTRGGYATAMCSGGLWTRRLDINACTCESDARCGYGSRCEGGICAAATCDVDGMRYAVGTTDIADPVTCNVCECMPGGTLSCTMYPCPVGLCPSGTTRNEVCLECGQAGGCSLLRTGCLPRCETSADCGGQPGSMCYPTTHVCGVGMCD
jgi:hypothetical protein